MLCNKKLNPILVALFLEAENWTFPLFILHSFILLGKKNIRLNSTHYLIMKFPNKRELQQTAFNNWSDTDFKGFIDLHKRCTAKSYSF